MNWRKPVLALICGALVACGSSERGTVQTSGMYDALASIILERRIPDPIARMDRDVFFHEAQAIWFREGDDTRKAMIMQAMQTWLANTLPIREDLSADFHLFMARALLTSERGSQVFRQALGSLATLSTVVPHPHEAAMRAIEGSYQKGKGADLETDAEHLLVMIYYGRKRFLEDAHALLPKLADPWRQPLEDEVRRLGEQK